MDEKEQINKRKEQQDKLMQMALEEAAKNLPEDRKQHMNKRTAAEQAIVRAAVHDVVVHIVLAADLTPTEALGILEVVKHTLFGVRDHSVTEEATKALLEKLSKGEGKHGLPKAA